MAGEETIMLTRTTDPDAAVEELTPGEYISYFRNEGYGGTAWAGWRCPRCRRTLLLLRSVHTVDFDGDVTPRVKCPGDGCELVGHFKLADWVPEPMGWA